MTTTSNTTRRRLLIAAGVGAAAVGAGLAWRRHGGPAAAPLSAPAQAFWDASFEMIDGSARPMSRLHGKPLLLNFWASWCAPCVKELPEIDQFARETPTWQVLGLAVDSKEAIARFLAKVPVALPVALAGMTGTGLARELGNEQGGLPFSVVFDARGEQVWKKLGPTTLDELRALARQHA